MTRPIVKETPHAGRGVFTTSDTEADAIVLHFHGPLLTLAQLDPEGQHDLQIGPDLYIGESGDIDDFVNHSCEPNCRVEIVTRADGLGHDARLVTLRPIAAGEELTFDYSTTSTEDERTWSMRCRCGTPTCRGIISGFGTLPTVVQARCIIERMVPDYVIDAVVIG